MTGSGLHEPCCFKALQADDFKAFEVESCSAVAAAAENTPCAGQAHDRVLGRLVPWLGFLCRPRCPLSHPGFEQSEPDA